jgi:hypothetical protein
MDPSEVLIFSQLFLAVDVKHRQDLQETVGAARDLYDRVLSSHTHIGQRALEALLPSGTRAAGDFFAIKQFIYFKPIQDDHEAGWLLPVVSLKYDFAKNPVELRIYVALAQMIGENVRFHGFRFEAPEGPGEGDHDFYHVQLIRGFARNGPRLNPPTSDLSIVPEKQPSFSLRADGPVTMAMAFFVSLYGMRFLDELRKVGQIPEKFFQTFRTP